MSNAIDAETGKKAAASVSPSKLAHVVLRTKANFDDGEMVLRRARRQDRF
jgi:hypothetical protein